MCAEKEERMKGKKIDKALLGYDPDKRSKTHGEVKSENQAYVEYTKLDLPPPMKGKHRFHYCQAMYEEIHSFIRQRE